jgi:uncharacterized protein YjbJ (UPF0337 family)
MTNLEEIKGNWNEKKGKLKQKLATIIDNDSMLKEGKKDEKIGKLQVRLGKTKGDLHKIIKTL